MNLKMVLIPVFFGIILYSCFKQPDIIPPEAEITEVYGITDSSAYFTVLVTSESNSQWDEAFRIWIDTLPLSESSIPLLYVSINPDAKKGIYETSTLELYSNTHYFSRIFYMGVFDVGGPNESKYFLIGEQKEFTTLP